MEELSIFADESGDAGETSQFYLITLVFHEQHRHIEDIVAPHSLALKEKRLPDMPMHLGPLLQGHDEYEYLDVGTRKGLLYSFTVLAQHLPFTYITFAYKKAEFGNESTNLLSRMKRDLVLALFDGLEYFQGFETVKIYYDNGQEIVTKALHDAIEYALARNAIVYRNATPSDYHFFQVADYLCTPELTALKYQGKMESATGKRFFGEWGTFKKNYLKKIRKKRIN